MMHLKELLTLLGLMYDCWCLNVSDFWTYFRDEITSTFVVRGSLKYPASERGTSRTVRDSPRLRVRVQSFNMTALSVCLRPGLLLFVGNSLARQNIICWCRPTDPFLVLQLKHHMNRFINLEYLRVY
jgi:hypothetical protein